MNLLRTGHPSFVMSNSATGMLAQPLIFRKNWVTYKVVFTSCRRSSIYEVLARLHLEKIGVLTTLTQRQADYIGVPVGRAAKPAHYRY